ncbi:hypothetical protein NPIL_589301 [Nephila pilipes]|uniref:Uncharacterized protein n=1 Tax=Nephila pilipes TaxID=299642 RepID=A0A8X6PBR6_NEPPI|nr:hypothetical protein NPIL_589301 [Nephila pilipes]
MILLICRGTEITKAPLYRFGPYRTGILAINVASPFQILGLRYWECKIVFLHTISGDGARETTICFLRSTQHDCRDCEITRQTLKYELPVTHTLRLKTFIYGDTDEKRRNDNSTENKGSNWECSI